MTDIKNYTQKDYAASHRFLFNITSKPNINFTLQTAGLAGVNLSPVQIGARAGNPYYVASNTVNLEPVMLEFLISDDFSEWLEMYRWMRTLSNNHNNEESCELTILDVNNKPLVTVIYGYAFPIDLDPVQFTTKDDSTVLSATVTIQYSSLKIVDKDGNVIDEKFRDSKSTGIL